MELSPEPPKIDLTKRASLVPPGAFIMGTDVEPFYGTALPHSRYAKPNEGPAHVVFTEAYRIDRHPVTNAEYAKFVAATGHRPPVHWKDGKPPREDANLPVVYVSWSDTSAYARWIGARLPTEAEWEKAARGVDGRIYPWGNEFEPPMEGASDSEQKPTGLMVRLKAALSGATSVTMPAIEPRFAHYLAPIGVRPATTSPYGLHGMAGNVWEWSADWYQPYEGNRHKDTAYGTKHKVLKGGSWLEVNDQTARRYFRCANRLHAPPDYIATNVGFRCAWDILPDETAQRPEVPTELLANYVAQQKREALRTVRKMARKQCAQDFLIASVLIGGGYYGMTIPSLAMGGFTMEILGVGFLFSAGVNFWRQWQADLSLRRQGREGAGV